MKKLAFALIVTVLACATGKPKSSKFVGYAIYDSDDRYEYGAADAATKHLADAVGLLVYGSQISCSGGSCTLVTAPYATARGLPLCADERFRGQPTVGVASSFLVAPDVMVTASHVIYSQAACDQLTVVFGFVMDAGGNVPTSVPSSETYRCASIIAHLGPDTGAGDWTVFRLDRAVSGRSPLAIRRSGAMTPSGNNLTAIGYPAVLPLKISPGGGVKTNDPTKTYFETTVDSVAGNSGSIVVDVATGLVEGLITSGPTGYDVVPDGSGGTCSRLAACPSTCSESAPTVCNGWTRVERIADPARFIPPAPAQCANAVRDPGESDVDCGGVCGWCAQGLACTRDQDCLSVNCLGGSCGVPRCQDGVLDGFESDVDCGASCTPCAAGKACRYPSDCASAACTNGSCAPTCTDGVKDGAETDVDCGGSNCYACALGKACAANGDCQSLACAGGACVPHTDSCADGLQNFGETDVDCGGSGSCPRCAVGKRCLHASDCVNSGACLFGHCH